ncbi:hypothetical protein [Sinomicrobium sp. M5D2P9]
MKNSLLTALLIGVIGICYTQPIRTDSIDYKMVYGMGLKADVAPIIACFDTLHPVAEEDIAFKNRFLSRFKYKTERVAFSEDTDNNIVLLYRIFETYWRESMLRPEISRDSIFKTDLTDFFKSLNQEQPFVKEPVTRDNLEDTFKKFIDSKGLHATGFGKTGKFYDLLLWNTEVPEEYPVELMDTSMTVTVHFMDDFVSLGWLEYVRMGNYYPGGWATEEGLYCVTKGYDLTSEKFLVHFLKHEAQHFADRARFKNLQAHQLEYRAKLLELYFGNETLYETLEKFVRTAKNDPSNAHPYANYNIIRNLSKKIFEEDLVKDLSRWKGISAQDIRKAAWFLYTEDTDRLKS